MSDTQEIITAVTTAGRWGRGTPRQNIRERTSKRTIQERDRAQKRMTSTQKGKNKNKRSRPRFAYE